MIRLNGDFMRKRLDYTVNFIRECEEPQKKQNAESSNKERKDS